MPKGDVGVLRGLRMGLLVDIICPFQGEPGFPGSPYFGRLLLVGRVLGGTNKVVA